MRKRRQKSLKVQLNFALLWVVFEWYHGSEGVNYGDRDDRRHKDSVSPQTTMTVLIFLDQRNHYF